MSSTIDRRAMLARSLGSAGLAWLFPFGLSSSAVAQQTFSAGDAVATPDERAAMANLAQAFMQQYDVPALSVAIGHNGAILYKDAFGWADRENDERATPDNLFRIASVTKPITSVTIFSLIEQGQFQLSDRIFGSGALLGTDYGRPPYNPGVDEITLEHLLTHTGGGWAKGRGDPMFINPEMDHAELIAWTLRNRPLDHPPGENFAYSNFGYCVLGRVIEKFTRQNYASYVADAILGRCGIGDMVIGGNTRAERHRGEVVYYGQGGNPYGMNVARMDSHGGWIARPTDYVNFLMHVSDYPTPPNILKHETIQTMVTPSSANAHYAKGWEVNSAHNWWHNGSLPGTSTIAVRTRSGFCWAGFTNTRRDNSALDGDLDKLMWKMVSQMKSWRG
jgi:CubicO group peptidase (beta-lactamase class C family)